MLLFGRLMCILPAVNMYIESNAFSSMLRSLQPAVSTAVEQILKMLTAVCSVMVINVNAVTTFGHRL